MFTSQPNLQKRFIMSVGNFRFFALSHSLALTKGCLKKSSFGTDYTDCVYFQFFSLHFRPSNNIRDGGFRWWLSHFFFLPAGSKTKFWEQFYETLCVGSDSPSFVCFCVSRNLAKSKERIKFFSIQS